MFPPQICVPMPESCSFLQKLPNPPKSKRVKRSLKFKFIAILSLLLAIPLYSQSDYLPESNLEVEIKRLDIRKTQHKENAPSVDRFPPDNKSSWGRITVQYIISKGSDADSGIYKRRVKTWIDTCTLSWKVVLGRNLDGEKVPVERHSVLIAKDIVFANIEVGNKVNHFSSLYIEPSILKRFSKTIVKDGLFVQLVIKREDKILTSVWARGNEFVQGEKIPNGFFPDMKKTNWFDSSLTQKLDYGLVSRMDTPWAWSSYDSYDFIIKK